MQLCEKAFFLFPLFLKYIYLYAMPKVFIITLYAIIGLTTFTCVAQDTISNSSADLRYREDQFYVGLTYNLLLNTPSGMKLRGLSGGIQAGFMRDMPINKRRSIAVAVGAGLAFDQFGQNLFIGETPNEESIFKVLNESNVEFSRNRLSMAIIEAPIEFRWRSSTPTSYRFWRVYAGFRVGYAYWYQSTFKQPGNNVYQTKIPEFDPVRLSATLSFGYNTFNFFASYSINPFFKNAYTENGESIDFRTLKVGLMFYIL